MAPQKGGQAAKQQGSAASTTTTTTLTTTSKAGAAKKPAYAGVALGDVVTAGTGAARPAAVVPAIPLPLMVHHQQRQASGKGKPQPQSQQHLRHHHHQQAAQPPAPQHVAAPAAAAAGAPLVVSSNGHPVASLEAALIDHQTPAPADDLSAAMARHKQRRFKRGDMPVNGSRVEKPGAPTPSTNGLHHNHTNGNTAVRKPSDRQHTYVNGLGDAHDRIQLPGHPTAAPVANGLSNDLNGHSYSAITFGDNPAAVTSSASSAHVSTAPSLAGDVEPVAFAPQSGTFAPKSCSTVPSAKKLTAPPLPLSLTTGNTTTTTRVTSASSASASVLRPDDFPAPAHHGHLNGTERQLGHPTPSSSAHIHAPHHMHPNGAAVLFGGAATPDSHTPSPAPGGFISPPSAPAANGINGVNGVNGEELGFTHHPHAHADSNSASYAASMGPYHLGPEHATTMDSYHPVLAHAPGPVPRGPLDGFLPNASAYEPRTPHSFHGSHASGEFNGLDNAGVPFRPNGHGFDHDHRNGRPHAVPPMPPFLAPQHFPRRPTIEEEFMDSIYFFRSMFNSSELADCTLEMKFPDGCNQPVKMHGHKLILARSPALKQLIMLSRAADPSSHYITFTAQDPYLRSDAWCVAVQRLYLHPLFTVPPMMANGAEFAGNSLDQFRFCLGYAAAGHFLEMKDVLLRGLELAAGLLNWNNLEEALGFAFEGSTQRHFIGDDGNDYFDIEFGYGRETRILMGAITNFLLSCFPPNFELDTSVADPVRYARIPLAALTTLPKGKAAPAIARGSSVRKPSAAGRHPNIQFGDIVPALPEEDLAAVPREPAKCSPELSRVLLNIPFDDLRYVMASETNGALGWNTAQDRYHALGGVVAEREARRLRAVDAVRAGAVPGSKEIQRRLSAPRRYDFVDQWDVLNWQEEVVQPSHTGVPTVTRTWVPQFAVPPEPEAEQPVYEPHPLESMV